MTYGTTIIGTVLHGIGEQAGTTRIGEVIMPRTGSGIHTGTGTAARHGHGIGTGTGPPHGTTTTITDGGLIHGGTDTDIGRTTTILQGISTTEEEIHRHHTTIRYTVRGTTALPTEGTIPPQTTVTETTI